MAERVMITAVSKFDFTNKEGQRIQGAKITYLNGEVQRTDDRRGVREMTVSVPNEMFFDVVAVPALYDLESGTRADKDGKPVVFVKGVQFVAKLDWLGILGLGQPGEDLPLSVATAKNGEGK